MFLWLTKRLSQAAMVVLAMTIIVFVGLHLLGNPVDVLLSPEATALERERLIADLGLDRPLWMQYFAFLQGIWHGNMGTSFVFNMPALDLIKQRLPATLELAMAALLIALVIGLPCGLVAGLRPKAWYSRLMMSGSVLGFSLPTFWVGLMLIMVFSVRLGWLPSSGRGETVTLLGVQWSIFTRDGLAHLILPAINLALFKVSMVMRLTRAGVAEAAKMDYVRFARAKGLSGRRIVGVHILKNILIPVVTVVGMEFGSTIAFAVVTESIFAYPGMGKLIIDSINQLDRPVIVAYLIVIVIMFVVINLVVDVLYRLLDPRVRLEGKA